MSALELEIGLSHWRGGRREPPSLLLYPLRSREMLGLTGEIRS